MPSVSGRLAVSLAVCLARLPLVAGCPVEGEPGATGRGAPDLLYALWGFDYASLCALTGDPFWCDQVSPPTQVEQPTLDSDGDNVPDTLDNCPLVPNPDQADCDADGSGDPCDGPDCNGNGVPDNCDVGTGTSHDCQPNGIPDECELADNDCDEDGSPDDCQPDCNENTFPDVCEILAGTAADCNDNHVPDECEIGDPPAHDCCTTGHGAGCSDPDIEACVCAADPYCCDGEWDGDCVAAVDAFGCGTCVVAGDCNGNGVLDECDVSVGTSLDCNGNNLPDECDLALCPPDTPSCDDCNDNTVPDECDIAAGTSADCNLNGRPDECDAAVTAIRLAQESATGEGDFGDYVLGFVEPLETTLSSADFYRYNLGSPASFNGPAPTLTFERSHLFLVQATDGLSLFVVHDRPGNAGGGSADTRYELAGDPDGAVRTVEDDPGEGYTGGSGATIFTAHHVWSSCCTDGLALTGLDGPWSLTVEFTSAVSGMDSWAAYSPEQDPITLALVPGRRVQLQVVTDPGAADCNGNDVLDSCDISGGTSQDCQPNGIPDECEEDWDGDQVIDDCEDCPFEPALTEPQAEYETDCDDYVDNDCDGYTDWQDAADCLGS